MIYLPTILPIKNQLNVGKSTSPLGHPMGFSKDMTSMLVEYLPRMDHSEADDSDVEMEPERVLGSNGVRTEDGFPLTWRIIP